MRQRAVIAIALACDPKVLIADEPTTALDVTIQAQVLDIMRELRSKLNTSLLLITHDLGVIAQNCDSVAVIYAGTIMEYGNVRDVFRRKAHPYTNGLMNSLPGLDADVDRLLSIPGMMPDPTDLPIGCPFYPRCTKRMPACNETLPPLYRTGEGHSVRCYLYENGGGGA
jgi:peptide/nickel transport system ATP-binding protein